jgi:hypothetical protein
LTWAKERNKLGHAETSEAVRKLGYTGALAARFLAMTTLSVNWMARLEEMTELDGIINFHLPLCPSPIQSGIEVMRVHKIGGSYD